jgi:hypothetical protein
LRVGQATTLPPCAHDGLTLGLGIFCLKDWHESGHAPIFTLLEDQVS